ncbi:MAG: hypothetical protein ACTHMS_00975, partial [Jatrophihabitans sp.]|uniref:hypothetical protein n=1 Tax=Jatrophihabitans sp. TaxID=1932789 RepID=UPI003F812B77
GDVDVTAVVDMVSGLLDAPAAGQPPAAGTPLIAELVAEVSAPLVTAAEPETQPVIPTQAPPAR